MPAPSLDDLLAHVSPSRPKVLAWLRAKVSNAGDPSKPLAIAKVLRLGLDMSVGDFDNDDDEAFEAWLEVAKPWAITRLLEGEDGVTWCSAALKKAWKTWKPVFERATTHDAKALGRTIRIATSSTSTKKELQQALRVYDAFPSHASPPPYAGHFYGAVQTLLDGRLATSKKKRVASLAECLSFCTVSPTGSAFAVKAVAKKKPKRARRR